MQIYDYIKILSIQNAYDYMWIDMYAYGRLILSKNYYPISQVYCDTGFAKPIQIAYNEN